MSASTMWPIVDMLKAAISGPQPSTSEKMADEIAAHLRAVTREFVDEAICDRHSKAAAAFLQSAYAVAGWLENGQEAQDAPNLLHAQVEYCQYTALALDDLSSEKAAATAVQLRALAVARKAHELYPAERDEPEPDPDLLPDAIITPRVAAKRLALEMRPSLGTRRKPDKEAKEMIDDDEAGHDTHVNTVVKDSDGALAPSSGDAASSPGAELMALDGSADVPLAQTHAHVAGSGGEPTPVQESAGAAAAHSQSAGSSPAAVDALAAPGPSRRPAKATTAAGKAV